MLSTCSGAIILPRSTSLWRWGFTLLEETSLYDVTAGWTNLRTKRPAAGNVCWYFWFIMLFVEPLECEKECTSHSLCKHVVWNFSYYVCFTYQTNEKLLLVFIILQCIHKHIKQHYSCMMKQLHWSYTHTHVDRRSDRLEDEQETKHRTCESVWVCCTRFWNVDLHSQLSKMKYENPKSN